MDFPEGFAKTLVEVPDLEDFVVPPEANELVGPELAPELDAIYRKIREIRDEFQGMRLAWALSVWQRDPRRLALFERRSHLFRRWIARLKIAKRARQDGWHQVFFFLNQGAHTLFCPLESTTRFDSYLASEILLFTLHESFQQTQRGWKRAVPKRKLVPTRAQRDDDFFMKLLPQSFRSFLRPEMQGANRSLLKKIPPSSTLKDGTPAELLEECRSLAEELEEMAVLIRRDDHPETDILEVRPDLWFAWAWGTSFLGAALFGSSKKDLLPALRSPRPLPQLRFDLLGRVQDEVQPGKVLDEQAPIELLRSALWILERSHERAYELYDKVDQEAILARWRQARQDLTEVADEDLEAALVVGLHRFEDPSPEEPLDESPDQIEEARSRRRRGFQLGSLRQSKLEKILTKEFGIRARGGKGSERVLQAPDGASTKYGSHKANQKLEKDQIQQILRRLGIELSEFVDCLVN